ncbi:hypothetical protein ACFV0C_22480 [Streptomyces sp. NPDC059568]|uniref:hypothetical protein n=1 Tax=Streptomyces sp. NPDC059568 TaxID=3346868 RepID=UPI0036A65C6F
MTETPAGDDDQAWFWTPEWQESEREASGDIAAGRTTFHEDVDSPLEALDGLAD